MKWELRKTTICGVFEWLRCRMVGGLGMIWVNKRDFWRENLLLLGAAHPGFVVGIDRLLDLRTVG